MPAKSHIIQCGVVRGTLLFSFRHTEMDTFGGTKKNWRVWFPQLMAFSLALPALHPQKISSTFNPSIHSRVQVIRSFTKIFSTLFNFLSQWKVKAHFFRKKKSFRRTTERHERRNARREEEEEEPSIFDATNAGGGEGKSAGCHVMLFFFFFSCISSTISPISFLPHHFSSTAPKICLFGTIKFLLARGKIYFSH